MEILIIILAGTLVLVVVAYLPLLNWAFFTSKREKQIREEAIREAERAAAEIISQAEDQARRILAETHGVVGKSEEVLETNLAGIVSDVQSKLSKDSNEYLREYSKQIPAMVTSLRETVEKQIGEERDKVMREITEYRQSRLNQVDDQIYHIVDQVVKEVLNTELNWKRDSELISSALTAAKKNYEQH